VRQPARSAIGQVAQKFGDQGNLCNTQEGTKNPVACLSGRERKCLHNDNYSHG
jgi:hypothetical protein